MKVSELKTALEDEVDDTIAISKHLRWLNDWYKKVVARIKKIDSNRFLADVVFDLTADNWKEIEISLPDDLVTIDRIEYLDPYSISTDPIKIKTTVFDEWTNYKSHLRWFRKWDKIVVRWLAEDIADVKLYYWIKIRKLNYDQWDPIIDDEIDFPDPSYDSILLNYELFRYYKSENMETDWKVYLAEFYTEIDEMISDLVPVSEPMQIKAKIENGIG